MTERRKTPFPAETSAGPEGPTSAEERLYDAYLVAALGGEPPDPASFLEGELGATESLRARLESLREATARGRAARDGGAAGMRTARPAEPGLPFERLGEFRLLRRLDEGGMG